MNFYLVERADTQKLKASFTVLLLITLFALGGFIMHCSESRFANE